MHIIDSAMRRFESPAAGLGCVEVYNRFSMRLRDAFPRTAQSFPGIADWSGNFSWKDASPETAVQIFNSFQLQIQNESDVELLRFSEQLRDDLIEQTKLNADETSAAMIDGVRFIIAQPAIYRTMATGQLGDCYGWLLWCISRNHDPKARLNTSEYALPPFVGASATMNSSALAFSADWVKSAYLLARKFGGLDNLANIFFDYSVGRAAAEMLHVDVESGAEALVAIANWATGAKHPGARMLTGKLLATYRSSRLSARSSVLIGMTFVTAAAQWTDKLPSEWARELLDRFRSDLVEHEVVQLLAVIVDSHASWCEHRNEILHETQRLAHSYRLNADSYLAAKTSLESRVSILHPLIYGLSKFGSTDDLMDLLWAWYGRDDWERADGNVLFISPNHSDGVVYLWPGGRWFAPQSDSAQTLDELTISISHALNEYFRGPSGDRAQLFDQRLAGTPVLQYGSALIDQMESHYRLSMLGEQLPKDFAPRSILVFPAHRDPLQALLAESLTKLAPIEATLARARPPRVIKKLSIWPGLTQTTETEISAIEAIGKSAGWTVCRVHGTLDEQAFEKFYRDSTADVLWVIGHGEYSPYRPYESGLVLDDNVLLTLPSIAKLQVPGPDRRLLVLNICSGGATQNLGGLAHVGLAQMLLSPQQQVVSHLWPIDYYAALAFGCAFASRLAHSDLPTAFSESLHLMRDQVSLVDAISAVSDDLAAAHRLTGERPREHLSSILSWGCPILLT